jgi:hypothetical protein
VFDVDQVLFGDALLILPTQLDLSVPCAHEFTF